MALRSKGISAQAVIAAEKRRVRALLDQDRADRADDRFRDEARQRFENGDSASSADAVIPPTREWLAKGDVVTFLPHQDPNSTRLVKSVKRQDLPAVRKMLLRGTIDFGGLLTCQWYRELYEVTGLSGSIASLNLNQEVRFTPTEVAKFTDRQESAQNLFREVRLLINIRFLPLIDVMILNDIPWYQAGKSVRTRTENVPGYFRAGVDSLAAARKAVSE